MKHYDVIIVGAGPAGLYAAICIDANKRVLIIEKNERAGKKLLMAGAGRCNITHEGSIRDFFTHYGDNHRFLNHSLGTFTNQDLKRFFVKRGLDTIVDKNGKVFPVTERSNDVLELLLRVCKEKQVDFALGKTVKHVGREEDLFRIQTDTEEFLATYVIVSTGGKSYPSTGSSGDGYKLAQYFNHTIISPKPALTPVSITNYLFSEISGVSLSKRSLSLYRNNRKMKKHRGDIGFTHHGLSGPGILDFSRYFEVGDILNINMVDLDLADFHQALIDATNSSGKIFIKNFFKSYDIPDNLVKLVLNYLEIDFQHKLSDINKKVRNKIANAFCAFPFEIESVGGYNVAMATKGGVSTKEINSKTMMSKKQENLYFAGEVIDIDGDTGGYNIQAACSTAFVAAESINHI